MKLTINDKIDWKEYPNVSFWCNDVEYKKVTAIDTIRGYLDYYKHERHPPALMHHRIFGKVEVKNGPSD